MFEDEKNEVSDPSKKGGKVEFGLADLKKLYANASSAAPHMEIKLCYSGELVYIKPLKVRDKKDILKAIESKNDNLLNRILDDLIEKYVEYRSGKALPSGSLMQKEKEQILVYMRLATGDKPKTINVVHQCPQCEKITKDIPFEIDVMSVLDYNRDNNDIVTLLGGQINIQMGPINLDEEKEIEALSKQKKLTSIADRQLLMVAALIKKVKVGNDVCNIFKLDEKLSFIEQLSVSDLEILTSYLEKYDFGVKMPFNFTCSHCGYADKQEVNSAVFFMS
jgi:hypothetical protein